MRGGLLGHPGDPCWGCHTQSDLVLIYKQLKAVWRRVLSLSPGHNQSPCLDAQGRWGWLRIPKLEQAASQSEKRPLRSKWTFVKAQFYWKLLHLQMKISYSLRSRDGHPLRFFMGNTPVLHPYRAFCEGPGTWSLWNWWKRFSGIKLQQCSYKRNRQD